MTRTVTIKDKEYYVVLTTMIVDDVEVSVQVSVCISNLNSKSKYKIQRYANLLFNRIFKLPPKPTTPKKPWYKFW